MSPVLHVERLCSLLVQEGAAVLLILDTDRRFLAGYGGGCNSAALAHLV